MFSTQFFSFTNSQDVIIIIMSTYCRARLTSSSDTLSDLEPLQLIQDWVVNESSLLFNYPNLIRIRLKLDPQCPLEITSFFQTECRGAGEVGPVEGLSNTPVF